MKAIYITEPGGPEKLIFGDRPDPEAGPGEVIVRARGTALNHADLSIRAGRLPTGGLPRILGLAMQGRPLTLMGSGARSRRSFAAMMHMVAYGGLRGVVGRTFDLGEAAKAHEVMAGRDFFGKLVLRVP
jgi:NADPH:quinone reductase